MILAAQRHVQGGFHAIPKWGEGATFPKSVMRIWCFYAMRAGDSGC